MRTDRYERSPNWRQYEMKGFDPIRVKGANEREYLIQRVVFDCYLDIGLVRVQPFGVPIPAFGPARYRERKVRVHESALLALQRRLAAMTGVQELIQQFR